MEKTRHPLLAKEDWWAIWLAGFLMLGVITEIVSAVPGVGRWSTLPTEAFPGRVLGLLSLGLGLVIATGIAVHTMSGDGQRHVRAFIPIFCLAVVAYTIANQIGIRAAGFGYAFWALLILSLIHISEPTRPY